MASRGSRGTNPELVHTLVARSTGKPVHARRTYGKGQLVLLASSELFRFDQENKNDVVQKSDFLAEIISWAAAGSSPVGGEPRMPTPMWGRRRNLPGI